MRFLALLSFLLLSTQSFGYIIKSKTILTKLTEKQPRGIMSVQVEIQFQRGTETSTVVEDWLVESESRMRLIATGPGVHVVNFYTRDTRVTSPDGNTITSATLPGDFFEPIFYAKNYEGAVRFLTSHQILPLPSGKRVFPIKKIEDITHDSEPFVSLVRQNLVSCYFLGQPTPATSAKLFPGVWIEQDRFLIRRLRLPSEAEVVSEEPTEWSGGSWFPRRRLLTWGPNTLAMQTQQVKVYPVQDKKWRAQLDPKTLTSYKDTSLSFPESELSQMMREFYSRFR